MSSIAVVDYGMGNLRSVAKALEHVAPEARIVVTSDAGEIAQADRVVFPGVGAMPVNLYVDTDRAAGVLVYVLDLLGDNIAIYDPTADTVRFAPTCARPAELAVDPVDRVAVVHCKGAFSYDNDRGLVFVPAQSGTFKLLE